jgi:uncharacterized protein YdaU (DUF1376 family)
MKAPAFQCYPKDYLSDEKVALMDLRQEGAYWRLLMHQWLEGSVPADVAALSRICRVSPREMSRIWPGVAPCFPPTEQPGRLANPRMERGRREQDAFRQERSESGRKGGRATAQLLHKDGSATSSAAPEPPAEPKPAVCSLLSAQTDTSAEAADTHEPTEGDEATELLTYWSERTNTRLRSKAVRKAVLARVRRLLAGGAKPADLRACVDFALVDEFYVAKGYAKQPEVIWKNAERVQGLAQKMEAPPPDERRPDRGPTLDEMLAEAGMKRSA